MKRNLTIVLTLILAGLLGACSGNKSNKTVVESSAVQIDAVPVVQTNGEFQEMDETKMTERSRVTGSDNSEIILSEDEFGNRIETRTFRGHERVDFAVVKRFADGRNHVFVHGKDGTIRQISKDHLEATLNYTGDDVAKIAEIQAPQAKPDPTPAIAQIPLQPVGPIPAINNADLRRAVPVVEAPNAEEVERKREAAKRAEVEKLRQVGNEVRRLQLAQQKIQD